MSRPKLPWRSPLFFLPNDGTQVWIRRLPWFDRPQLATFDMTSDLFTVTTLQLPARGSFDRTVPRHLVHSWKFRYLADELEAFTP